MDWQNESAAFWMGVLTDLKARGVEDILITVTDNLNGFTETIKSVFLPLLLKYVWYTKLGTPVAMSSGKKKGVHCRFEEHL